jgi:hypothetical protein
VASRVRVRVMFGCGRVACACSGDVRVRMFGCCTGATFGFWSGACSGPVRGVSLLAQPDYTTSDFFTKKARPPDPGPSVHSKAPQTPPTHPMPLDTSRVLRLSPGEDRQARLQPPPPRQEAVTPTTLHAKPTGDQGVHRGVVPPERVGVHLKTPQPAGLAEPRADQSLLNPPSPSPLQHPSDLQTPGRCRLRSHPKPGIADRLTIEPSYPPEGFL